MRLLDSRFFETRPQLRHHALMLGVSGGEELGNRHDCLFGGVVSNYFYPQFLCRRLLLRCRGHPSLQSRSPARDITFPRHISRSRDTTRPGPSNRRQALSSSSREWLVVTIKPCRAAL